MGFVSKYSGEDLDNTIATMQQIFNLIYPIGSIYLSSDSTNPAQKFGGTWEQITDKMIMAAGSKYIAGSTGGADSHIHATSNHTLITDEIPAHAHTRGTMEITGAFRTDPDNGWNRITSTEGAFSSDTTNKRATGGGTGTTEVDTRAVFTASKAWTGETSVVGNNNPHNHGNTSASSNLPPYLVAYIWKRIA